MAKEEDVSQRVLSGKSITKISLLTAGLLLSVASSTMAANDEMDLFGDEPQPTRALALPGGGISFANFDFATVPSAAEPNTHAGYAKRTGAESPVTGIRTFLNGYLPFCKKIR